MRPHQHQATFVERDFNGVLNGDVVQSLRAHFQRRVVEREGGSRQLNAESSRECEKRKLLSLYKFYSVFFPCFEKFITVRRPDTCNLKRRGRTRQQVGPFVLAITARGAQDGARLNTLLFEVDKGLGQVVGVLIWSLNQRTSPRKVGVEVVLFDAVHVPHEHIDVNAMLLAHRQCAVASDQEVGPVDESPDHADGGPSPARHHDTGALLAHAGA